MKISLTAIDQIKQEDLMQDMNDHRVSRLLHKNNFEIEEFKYLTSQVEMHHKHLYELERNSLIGLFGIYAWIFGSNPQQINAFAVSIIPILIICFVMARILTLHFTMREIYDYIMTLEDRVGVVGWQNFFSRLRKPQRQISPFRFIIVVFWSLALLVSICASYALRPSPSNLSVARSHPSPPALQAPPPPSAAVHAAG